jgi:hypothetical protein
LPGERGAGGSVAPIVRTVLRLAALLAPLLAFTSDFFVLLLLRAASDFAGIFPGM